MPDYAPSKCMAIGGVCHFRYGVGPHGFRGMLAALTPSLNHHLSPDDRESIASPRS